MKAKPTKLTPVVQSVPSVPSGAPPETLGEALVRLGVAERKVQLMEASANEPGGSLDNQVSYLTMQMLAIANTLALPADKKLSDLAAWAVTVMQQRK